MKNGICPKCGSTEIMANVRIRDRGGRFNRDNPLKAIVEEPAPVEKGQFWMSDSVSGHVRAWICSQCGFTEFYTDNLENLYQAYKRYRLSN